MGDETEGGLAEREREVNQFSHNTVSAISLTISKIDNDHLIRAGQRFRS